MRVRRGRRENSEWRAAGSGGGGGGALPAVSCRTVLLPLYCTCGSRRALERLLALALKMTRDSRNRDASRMAPTLWVKSGTAARARCHAACWPGCTPPLAVGSVSSACAPGGLAQASACRLHMPRISLLLCSFHAAAMTAVECLLELPQRDPPVAQGALGMLRAAHLRCTPPRWRRVGRGCSAGIGGRHAPER